MVDAQDLEAAIDPLTVTTEQVESNILRSPDGDFAERAIALIESIRDEGDSVGGVVECVVRNLPMGLGSP